MISSKPIRFFVSFSSHDLSYVREIMAALKGQGLDFWDYSDMVQSIEAGESINERLLREIESCTHMIIVISRNSADMNIGRFCRIELEYALGKNNQSKIQLFPVLLDHTDPSELLPPYDRFKDIFCCDLDRTPESIVKLTSKLCHLIDQIYIPPIEAHPRLPFWKLFRKEVEDLAYSNKEHVDLMMLLGEFNEYYKKSEIENALNVIRYFIETCNFRIKGYKVLYPLIVKAVCEEELGMYDEAMSSYIKASLFDHDNQDIIGGIGTVFFRKGQYEEAAGCFRRIINEFPGEDISNARINLIISKQASGEPITPEEEVYLTVIDISSYPDDLKTNILNAQAAQMRIRGENKELERKCLGIIQQKFHDTVTIRLLQVSFLNRGMFREADEVILKALEESKRNPRLDSDILRSFLE
jgi:tetratricopeptide (TPR) repeat protein